MEVENMKFVEMVKDAFVLVGYSDAGRRSGNGVQVLIK